jgi:hypothetical protein
MNEYDDGNTWVKGFIDCLGRSTFADPTLEDAIALKQKHLPSRIYKYRKIDAFSLENLRTNHVWMASPDAFNDPYDCSFMIAEEQAAADFIRVAYPKYSRAQKAAELSKLSIPEYILSAIEPLRLMRHTTKICSFSATNDSLLMWAHYAANHTGFCIEYDLEPLPPEDPIRRNIFPVIYSKELHDMTAYLVGFVADSRDDFHQFDPLLSVLKKFEGWQYEREWRLVRFEQMLRPDHPQEVPKPSGVILGSKTSEADAATLAGICSQQGITLSKMNLAADRFELSVEPYVAT